MNLIWGKIKKMYEEYAEKKIVQSIEKITEKLNNKKEKIKQLQATTNKANQKKSLI